jgi:hypothetical protein
MGTRPPRNIVAALELCPRSADWPYVTHRISSPVALLGIALVGTACSNSGPKAAAGPAERWTPPGIVFKSGTDESAMADLKVSPEWTLPSCRWLETGAWVLAWPQETAIYEAARDLGYIEMEQAGMGNRVRPEPAWRIALTEAGKAESARCGRGSSKPEVFGMPVSERKLISGKRYGEPDAYNPDRTLFDVQFEWVPTPVGDRVKHVLTSHMTVQQGVTTAKVALRYGEHLVKKGGNRWWVEQIHERRTPQ